MKKLINYYYDLFDNKISDTSMVVGIIGVFIFLVGTIAPVKDYSNINYKSNLAEMNVDFSGENYIFLNGKKYFLSTSNEKEIINMKQNMKY